MHPSVKKLCEDFFSAAGLPYRQLPAWYFCDNQVDADECAALVLSGDKRATASSLWWLDAVGEPFPEPGDLDVITNWAGEAQCIIETTDVSVVPYNEITSEFAETEGEGDKTLAWWKKVHWAYYQRVLADTAHSPADDMPIVCQIFRVVHVAT